MHLPGSQTILTGVVVATLKRALLSRGLDVDEDSLHCGLSLRAGLSLRVSDLHVFRPGHHGLGSAACSVIGCRNLEFGASFFPPSLYATVTESFVNLEELAKVPERSQEAPVAAAGGGQEEEEEEAAGDDAVVVAEPPAGAEEEGHAGDESGLFRALWTVTNPGFLFWLRVLTHPLIAMLSVQVRGLSVLLGRDPEGGGDRTVRIGRFIVPPHLSFVGRTLKKRFLGSDVSVTAEEGSGRWEESVSRVLRRRAIGFVERALRGAVNLAAILVAAACFYISVVDARSVAAEGAAAWLGLREEEVRAAGRAALGVASTLAFVAPLFPNANVAKREQRCYEARLELQSSKHGMRVAVKVPSWALAVEREGARGRLQVTKAACACVIRRGQKRVLLLRATAEAKRALVSAVEDGRPDPGTLVVDDLRCKVGGTLDPCGDVEAKSTLGLGRLAAHSQRDERAFHANHGREAVVSAAYERPSLTMGLEARVGFIYLGTAALAQLSRFASSSSSKSSTASDPSQAPACKPDPEPAAAEEGEGGGSLRVDAEGVEITLGRTGSSRELCFRLRGGCHLQSSSSDGGYLGVEDTHLSLCSAVGDDEAAVVTRSEVFCQKKAGAGGSREGGLEVSPFSVLLSVGELREIIAMGGEDWGGGGGGGAGASSVSERDSRLEALEGRAASEGPPIGKLVCVRSPLEAGVAACYFQWDLRPRDLEVAGRRESQISYLPPSLSRPRTACGLFRVVAVRGQSKCFRLQLTAPGWEGYHLGVGTGNEVTITRVASRASVLSLDRRGRLQSKDGAPLCLSRLGYWFFQPGSVGQAELVVAAEESVSAACSVFEVSLPEIRFHLLAKKPRAAGFSPRDLASGGMPRGPVDDVSEEELCRASLSVEAEQWGGELGTSSVYHFGASVMLRESNDPEMTETFRADRITMASFAAPKSTESVFGVFAFAPVDLRVHELGVECACIVLQGLREDTGKFRVRHLADLQSRLCGGRAKADRGEGEAAAPKRRKAKSKAAKKTSGWRVSVYHAARISIKVHSCAVEEFLVGEVQELSLRSAASSQLEDVRAVVGKLQVDTYHPDAESRVCLRRRAPHKTLGMPSSSVEPSISARYRSEAPEGRPTETEISAFLALSPASIVLHEPVVQECLSLFPGYGKAEVEAAQKIQRFWKRRKGPKDNTLGGMDEARPRRGWFGRARGRGRGRGRTPGEENTAATKIQRWWKKKKKKEKGRQVRRGKASTKWMDGTRKIKVLDILLPDLEATFKFDWSSGDVDRRNLASSLDRGTVLDDFQTILSVLGAPEVGTIHVAQKRILLSDLEMSPKEIAKTASQQLTQGVLLAIAREHVDSLGIPWMDGVVGEYLEAVGKGRGAAEVSGDGGEARGQERGGSWVTRPWRILLDPVVFLSRAAAASVKHAGWTLLVSAALDMTDRAVKSAETDGLRGVYSAVTATGINMLTTPPKQAVFRIWASRNALTSDLRVTFRLSGQHASTNAPYLEAYVQGIVDHVFQLKNTMVSVDDDVLTMQNLPVLEREREELIDYVEFILDSEGLLLVEGEGASGTKKGRHVAGLDSTSFSAKLRHLPHKRKDPRKQLLYIGYLFVQNVAVVMSSGFFVRSLPFHRAMGRLENRWVRRGLGTAIVFGYRRLQWLVPGTFAKKVCHSYLLNLAFGPKEEENEEEGAEGGKN